MKQKVIVRANFLNSFHRKTGQKVVERAWLRVNIISDCNSKQIFKMRN